MLQTQEARAEAASLMGVHANLCTPKNGDILVAATQVRTAASAQNGRTAGSLYNCSALRAGTACWSLIQLAPKPSQALLVQD
jgi:hypothetical protein